MAGLTCDCICCSYMNPVSLSTDGRHLFPLIHFKVCSQREIPCSDWCIYYTVTLKSKKKLLTPSPPCSEALPTPVCLLVDMDESPLYNSLCFSFHVQISNKWTRPLTKSLSSGQFLSVNWHFFGFCISKRLICLHRETSEAWRVLSSLLTQCVLSTVLLSPFQTPAWVLTGLCDC